MADEQYVDVLGADKLEQQIATNAPIEDEADIPEKFKGKPKGEIAKAYTELEKLQGRQAKELGELRQLADSFIKAQLNAGTSVEHTNSGTSEGGSQPAPVDPTFYATELMKVRRMETELALREKHPDYQDVVKDPEFANYVKASKMRTKLYLQADKEFDFDAADELISGFKDRKVSVATAATEEALAEQRNSALKTAKVAVGGQGSEGSSRKIYRRADLIRLKQTDPDRYMQMADEIQTAYMEGRVK